MFTLRLLRSRRFLLAAAWVVAAVFALSAALAVALGFGAPQNRVATVVPSAHANAVISALNADRSIITLGANRSAPTAYVFEDPNCVFCAQFDTLAKPLLDAGRIQLHVVLVAFLKPSSAGRAAAIWSDIDPGSALLRNAEHFSAIMEKGGVAPITVNSQDLAHLRTHMDLLRGLGPISTPTLLYRIGDRWLLASGASPSLLNEIAASSRVPQAGLPETDLRIGNARLRVEVAKTHEEKREGLMNRPSLPENHGMLFVWSKTQPVCMWMKNTPIPLSVAFISADGRIVNIADMQPETEDVHCAQTDVRYALETPLHWFSRHEIIPGAQVTGLPAR